MLCMATAYQLRISLRDVVPEVWRRIQVPSDFTIDATIWALLAGMGWQIYHLYDLQLGQVTYGMPDPDFNSSIADAREVVLGNALTSGDELVLNYDYGDGWTHDVLVESMAIGGPREKARCVEGAQACPPEDCGGPPGYEHLLEVLSDPDNPEHEGLAEWADGFDAAAFDVKTATKAMAVALRANRG